MKFIQYQEEGCNAKVIFSLKTAVGAVQEFFNECEVGDRAHLEIIEMTQEDFEALPESMGC